MCVWDIIPSPWKPPTSNGIRRADSLVSDRAYGTTGFDEWLMKFYGKKHSRLLDVPIFVASSGFQFGGDGGPVGRKDRRFRLECKKYSDTSSLNRRELLGEIDHALARDEAIEAWFLVSTRNVPEQLAQDLIQKGEKIGVPVVIIDWTAHDFAPLAALCAFDPDVVEAIFSKSAGVLARELQPVSANAIERLRRDLQPWALGFETLRKQSHEILDKIWNDSKESNAKLGQDAAGGARTKRVKRKAVCKALDDWVSAACPREP